MDLELSDCMTQAAGVDTEGLSEARYAEIAYGSPERCIEDWTRLQTIEMVEAGAVRRCPKCKRLYLNNTLAPWLRV